MPPRDLLAEVASHVASQIVGGPAARLRSYNPRQARSGYEQGEAEYVDQAEGEETCGGCVHFVGVIYGGPEPEGAAACRIVDGKILPQGWCRFYQSRSEPNEEYEEEEEEEGEPERSEKKE